MSTVNQTIKNFANDLGIDLPGKFSRLEITAAIMADFREKKGHFPDRHEFIAHIETYQKTLPSDSLEAGVVIATAAADLLGLPGLKTDAERVQHAREIIAQAEADVAEAEQNKGRRLSRIHSLEQIVRDLSTQRSAWQIDFAGETAAAENLILENWGRGYQISGPFSDLQAFAVLKKLQPAAYKMIDGKIADSQAELDQLKLA
jgi:hypothetical protein